jgi:hypothetical protein
MAKLECLQIFVTLPLDKNSSIFLYSPHPAARAPLWGADHVNSAGGCETPGGMAGASTSSMPQRHTTQRQPREFRPDGGEAGAPDLIPRLSDQPSQPRDVHPLRRAVAFAWVGDKALRPSLPLAGEGQRAAAPPTLRFPARWHNLPP